MGWPCQVSRQNVVLSMLRFLQRDKDVRRERLLVALRAYVSDHLHWCILVPGGLMVVSQQPAVSYCLNELRWAPGKTLTKCKLQITHMSHDN